jgi:hypothetical protein
MPKKKKKAGSPHNGKGDAGGTAAKDGSPKSNILMRPSTAPMRRQWKGR